MDALDVELMEDCFRRPQSTLSLHRQITAVYCSHRSDDARALQMTNPPASLRRQPGDHGSSLHRHFIRFDSIGAMGRE